MEILRERQIVPPGRQDIAAVGRRLWVMRLGVFAGDGSPVGVVAV